MKNKEIIEIIDLDGKTNSYELITKIKSTRDNKIYYIMTEDKEIGEEVNIIVGYILEKEDDEIIDITMVLDEEELLYVEDLINKEIGDIDDI